MGTYLHPGVYVEEIPSGSKPIEGVGTSTAAFVGYTTKGPIGEPELILKWDDYDVQYGGIRDTETTEGDPMGFSVSAFFQNGGGKAYIVRITQDWKKDDTPVAFDAVKAVGYLDDPSVTGDHGLEFTATNEGTWANGLVVRMSVSPISSDLYDVQIGRKNDDGELDVLESFSNVSIDPTNPLFIKSVINDVSEFVTVDRVAVASKTITSGSYLGTSTSGDLDALTFALTLAGDDAARTLTIAIDGNQPITRIIPAGPYNDLGAVAKAIEDAVRSGTGSQENFTCVAGTVSGTKRLVLTSGTREAGSSVVIAPSGAPSPNIVETLKLDVVNGATQRTGQQSADAAWSGGAPEDTLSGGVDGSQPLTDDYTDVFTKFLKYRDINIICLPGQAWASDGSGNPVIDAAIGHASKMKSRMVLVDPPLGTDTELETAKDVNDLTLPSKTYSVLYYPWVKVANPFYNAERNPGAPKTVLVPPSGFAAGMWAKTDGKRGVWKAPAGMETGLIGVAGLQWVVEDGEQDSLNPYGVNCLRKMPGAGHVIWGARTLATKADPEWRYVPVRRTAIMIEQSIYEGIQWAVFEPNDHRLWSALRGNIGNFMNGLFRVGAFQGEKASDAYFVRCGLGDTMTQGDIDAGQVIVIVGFAPLKPAEFVIVRIQQKVNQQ
ncbi:MAG: phage tail sheath family protein [Planctomycetes bacterium]|nr:phage tail sheath family protein [Planctomycetota bacterium]